jgi:hypothetical protein
VRLPLERGDVRLPAEVVAVAEVDVSRPAERGKAETDSADRQAGPTQDAGDDRSQLRRTKSIATGTPSSSKRSRSLFSTQ